MKRRCLLYACCALWIAETAQAAAVFSVETITAPAGPAGSAYSPVHPAGGPSSTDILNGALPIAQAGNFQQEASTGVSALTNGSIDTFYGTAFETDNHTAYATGDASGAGQFVTYYLGGTYDLSSVVTFGGWADGGRDEQLYDVLSSTDGVNFNTLASFAGVNIGSGTPISHRVALTEDSLFHLATGITHIRINFLDVENNFTGYTEIDVFGDLVPEPTSAVTAGLGALGVLALRRRG
jgi:hypothetical protein